jgi:hypothetical protein
MPVEQSPFWIPFLSRKSILRVKQLVRHRAETERRLPADISELKFFLDTFSFKKKYPVR